MDGEPGKRLGRRVLSDAQREALQRILASTAPIELKPVPELKPTRRESMDDEVIEDDDPAQLRAVELSRAPADDVEWSTVTYRILLPTAIAHDLIEHVDEALDEFCHGDSEDGPCRIDTYSTQILPGDHLGL